ncbi:MAG: 4Fe-4S binding protein, partial [Firmicutes bacterium]|nr:4Fe-4S binding protein [Bacillota bacterium]
YGVFPNVVTGKEFEKILSDMALNGQEFLRPSGGSSPLKVAWIQCVGSRNKRHLEYCSSICCQYAFKEAMLLKQVHPFIETVIFGMDARPFSMNGEEYMQNALSQGVRFERTRIFNLEETDGKNIRIRYAREDGSLCEEEFGLVVLSTGLKPNRLSGNSSALEGIDIDEYGFAKTSALAPCATTRKGIFSAGVFNGPKDIASSVIDARAAAMGILESLENHILAPDEAHKEFDVDDEPRVGVFVCSCGGTIDKVISASTLAGNAKSMPFVVYSKSVDFACLPDGLEQIQKIVKKYELNRVVLAGCTPRLRDKEMSRALEDAGILPAQTERVNIREQVAWVHANDRKGARVKALDLVRAGVRKAVMAENAPVPTGTVLDSLLVAGGTVGGLTAALAAAGRGVKVYLVVKEESLEKSLAASGQGYTLNPRREHTVELIKNVTEHPLIEILTSSRIVSADRSPGHLKTKVATEAGLRNISHGAVVLASGAGWRRQGWLWSHQDMVKTQSELTEILNKQCLADMKTVVFLPPFDPGSGEFSNYSKAGCATALQNALRVKYSLPDVKVYFLYQDMLVYGTDERLYNEARQNGIIFIRFGPGGSPQVKESGEGLQVEVVDHILGLPFSINPQLVVMEASSVSDPENMVLAGLFGAQIRADGYFREANRKFKPLDSNAAGVYLCGLARGPVSFEEEIVQGKAAAMGALTYLIKERPQINGHVARVKAKWCNGCGLCVSACPSGARSIDPETLTAVVNEAMCLGCGAC